MAEVFSKNKRSWNMSRIRSKNTNPEKLIRSLLHKKGFRYRLHVNDLPGRPDIVLKKYRIVIFCHGCFWHQHPGCKRAVLPKTNIDYWIPKLKRNADRFEQVKEALEKLGWRVAVVWECETKNIDTLGKKLEMIIYNK